MRHAAALAKDGRGQLVAVVGKPGVGKSRLFYEFKLREGGAENVGPAFKPVNDSLERLSHTLAGRDACPTRWMVLEAFAVGLATGQFPAAREHPECAIELLDAAPSSGGGTIFPLMVRDLLAAALTILGFLSTALKRNGEWLIHARLESDSNSIASALSSGLMYQIVLRDSHMVAERANELLSLAAEHGVAFYNSIIANFAHGWAKASVGRAEEGMAEMRRIISDP